jgi:hypothetical protein
VAFSTLPQYFVDLFGRNDHRVADPKARAQFIGLFSKGALSNGHLTMLH